MTTATRLQTRILIVEDENIVAMDLRASLERLGYEVTGTLGTGEDAVAEVGRRRPDLVFMDIRLRGEMDGIEAAGRIRRDHDVPVVYLTSYSDDATLARAGVTQPFGYLIKPFDERELHVAVELALARHRAQREHERLLEEQATRAALERESRWSRFLAEASARLASSLDFKRTLDVITALAIPELADWAAVHLVEEGNVRTVAVHHGGGLEAALWELIRRFPPDPGRPHGYPYVIRTGEPELLQDFGETHVEAIARDPEHRRLLRELQVKSSLCVPLIVRGETLGALTLAMAESNRRYDPSDLDRGMSLAQRCASAIDNALLYQQARGAITARDEFLSVAAHELRTPLSALSLTVQVVQRSPPWDRDATLQERLAGLRRQVDALATLVGRLLDVSRIGIMRLEIVREETDLAALVRDLTERFRESAARARCALDVRTPETLVGKWDPIRLEQVLTNLLGNAFKFAPGCTVVVAVAADDSDVMVTIKDDGPGIPKDQVANLFQRFARGVSVKRYGGLGLGLFLSQQIIEAHGGRVTVESEEGRGTTFVIQLPWVR